MCRIDLKKSDAMTITMSDLIAAKALLEEAQAQYDAIADAVKQYMTEHDADTLCDGLHTVTYKTTSRATVDTKALKSLLGDALEPYMKHSTYKRMEVRV